MFSYNLSLRGRFIILAGITCIVQFSRHPCSSVAKIVGRSTTLRGDRVQITLLSEGHAGFTRVEPDRYTPLTS